MKSSATRIEQGSKYPYDSIVDTESISGFFSTGVLSSLYKELVAFRYGRKKCENITGG